MKKVNVIGAGLAGVEAVYQLIKRGIEVNLYEMRPNKSTGAHKTGDFAELVCSNSLRAAGLKNAVGVLKQEMMMNDSLIIKTARCHAVPAGGSLAVDREGFSKAITEYIRNQSLVHVFHEEVIEIPEGPTIIASGPLTSSLLSKAIADLLGEEKYFYFYDAAAPILTKESIDLKKAYFKSRYDKGDAEYINCPMSQKEFENFYEALIHAETVKPHDGEEKFFEGCMPFEEIARRGKQTLLFGPMKPVGLETPDGKRPYAVVQLRQDNAIGSLYNIVGFQTHLKWGEQERIIHMIPGLENAQIIRYGVMHRNSYINSPLYLNRAYQYKNRDNLFFAGQMTGVEGYVESAQSGICAGINMARYLQNKELLVFPRETVMGALSYYITHASFDDFQPMKANFGILPSLKEKVKKKERKEVYASRALKTMETFLNEHNE
ncbi:MAG: methylenetetrahydrofolate--tRNA-(uracil(54)-C(5))-methyltransferase (FADH(2)-oxidizing) TrmFO [Eggerthia catenaformis]|uniref:methylenetetrahydrofolate--tRNA-(uracil(54)- C(5))-methyltransferase (FADH(2)-oxidizing) TrmFO n=1 Tax=Eggerthia catenaformis TaxID=31973 RepID=UPI00047BB1FD|nr:methylenetetrahydrofolate--tRNA-(uracil(54)-C(5))-methyltransferase (FADH(2)-oxidizing) TrmFO [Eggerthia catenaformis]OUC51737.1 FADH(2)-oxidizing methylenetetrahydrofolate--tRNA-(uracil(54)-C(5))-methyltransferase TrmFO [Eggerthia catenaformis]